MDAAYFIQLRKANLGMMVRDHAGTIMYCAMKRVGDVDSPLHVEFKAILFGLKECRNIVINSLFIKSDSLLAIRKIEIGPRSFWSGKTLFLMFLVLLSIMVLVVSVISIELLMVVNTIWLKFLLVWGIIRCRGIHYLHLFCNPDLIEV